MMNNISNPISLGLINFTNCLPINYTLEKWALEDIVLSWGHPVLINQLMKEGQVHVAPISAFEYIQNENDYVLIKEACITSDAECGSVILFSNHKLEDLAGKKIGIPHDSATSINMLKIILNEKGILTPTPYPLPQGRGKQVGAGAKPPHLDTPKEIQFIKHKYEKALSEALGCEFDAVLYIGDNALVSRYKYNETVILGDLDKTEERENLFNYDEQIDPHVTASPSLRMTIQCKEPALQQFYQYDLGKVWKKMTGLPPVFGLWVARADWAVNHKDDFDRVKFLISKAVEAGLGMYFNEVIQKAASELDLADYFIKDYLTAKIKYNLTTEHKKSLDLFKKLYQQILTSDF